MRIGMMTDTYKPYISGITNYIALNKRYLEKQGHEVYVFTFGNLDHQDDETRIVRSPGKPLIDTGFYLSFRYSRGAKELLQTMDVVHVHHPFLSGLLALRYCRPHRIPVIFTNHTRYDLYAQAYLPLLPEAISDTLLETYMPPYCEAVNMVVSPSPGMAKILRQLQVESHIEVIPNGVELRRSHQTDSLSRSELGFSPDDILLIYAGRLGPEKNLAFLLQAFIGVAQALGNVHLLIAGDGPLRDKLTDQATKSKATEQIHFVGMIEYEKMPAYLAMCDAFTTASVTEVDPLSVIEAMDAGLPVLGIHSPGVGDTVEDALTGFLSDENLASFTAKMTRLCIEHNLRKKMGEAARQVSARYAIERTTQMMISLYEQVIAERRPHQPEREISLHKVPRADFAMSQHNQEIGRWGEGIAAEYLQKRGYEFVDSNIRTPYGEIDLILRRGEIVIFVEVKTRTSARYGYPEESITLRKQEHMLASAEHYAQENALEHWQIDAISVEGKPSGKKPKITHFEDVI